MPTYPGGIPSIPTDGSWSHDDVANEIEAIATELGVNPSGDSPSVADRLNADPLVDWRYDQTQTASHKFRTIPGMAFLTTSTQARVGGELTIEAPFHLRREMVLYDFAALTSGTPAAAGSGCRVGIYRLSDPPDATNSATLVVDAGTYLVDTAGEKQVILSTPEVLPPGNYAVGFLPEAAFTHTAWTIAGAPYGFQGDGIGAQFTNNRKIPRAAAYATYSSGLPSTVALNTRYNTGFGFLGAGLVDYVKVAHLLDIRWS